MKGLLIVTWFFYDTGLLIIKMKNKKDRYLKKKFDDF